MIFCVYIIYIFLYVWLVTNNKVCSQVISVLVERYVPLARASYRAWVSVRFQILYFDSGLFLFFVVVLPCVEKKNVASF